MSGLFVIQRDDKIIYIVHLVSFSIILLFKGSLNIKSPTFLKIHIDK